MNFNSYNGLEIVERAAFLRFFDYLNTAIDEAQARWTPSDAAFDAHIGRPHVPVVVENIDTENFYEGHRPSLIRAPVESYPNLSVWGVRSTAHPESALMDHTDIFSNLIFVEVMCKATEDEGEGIVSKRINRTCEAVAAVMAADSTLGGVVTGIDGSPALNLSDVFTRKEETTYGAKWFWQGARLEYTVRKDAVLPSSRPGSNFRPLAAGMTAADMALIDQA